MNYKEKIFNMQEIVLALTKKGITNKCSVCNKNTVVVMEGFIKHPIGLELDGELFTPALMNTVGLICENCGHLSIHVLPPLGLMPEIKDTSV
jgi:hypothetical protein